MSWKTILLEHSDDILTGVTIAGVGATIASTVKATRRIDQLWDDTFDNWKTINVDDENENALQSRAHYEIAKGRICWKEYLRIFVPAAVTIASVILMRQQKRKIAAVLTTSLAAAERAYSELSEEASEALGPKKFDEVRSTVAEKLAKKNDNFEGGLSQPKPAGLPDYPIQVHIYDACGDKWFWGDLENIRRAAIKMNDELTRGETDMYTYNDFMSEIGQNGSKLGEYMAWRYDPVVGRSHLIDPDFTPALKDDEPYVIMNLKPEPTPAYFYSV